MKPVEDKKAKKLLVQVCCAPCSSYSFEKLINDGYEVTGYFYNPNIHPELEYKRRLEELIKFAGIKKYPLIIEEDPHEFWFHRIKGLEKEKEGGKRCEECFKMRLEKTAFYAMQNGFDCFTTVLTISPHKNSSKINQIGKNIAEKYNIAFLEENFKKKDGFKKSIKLSEEYGFYRQSYCGCIYSF